MSWNFRARPAAFARDASALAAMEFAFIAPTLFFLMLAGFDYGGYVLATERVEAVANSVAEMLAQTRANSNAVKTGDGTVTDSDLHYYNDSALFTFPAVIAAANNQGVNWWSLLNVNMASVKFVPTDASCTSNCTYQPKVVWSQGWRSCNTQIQPSPDASTISPTTLPTDLFGPISQIVVDVQYTFKPTFGAAFLPSIPITRSAYMSPRNVPLVETYQSSWAPTCPGAL